MPKILIALVIVFLFLFTVESSGHMLDYFIRPPLTATLGGGGGVNSILWEAAPGDAIIWDASGDEVLWE